MKTTRKVILYIISVLAGLILILTFSVWLFKDNIIQQFVKEANKNINTPISIGKIDVSVWSDFPEMSIVFYDVYVEDSDPGKYPLLTAKKISFSLNPWDAYHGRYAIKGLKVADSETSIKISDEGIGNYAVTKGAQGKDAPISFDLKNVTLENTRFTYHDFKNHDEYKMNSHHLKASISIDHTIYSISAQGDLTTEEISTSKKVFLKNKDFEIKAKLTYDQSTQKAGIDEALLKINKSSFSLKGDYTFAETGSIDMIASGKNTDIHTILSLLPTSVANSLSAYRSDGNLYLTVKLKGEVSKTSTPSVSVAFGCTDARVFNPGFKSKIEHANLTGSFASPSLTDFSHAALFLKNVSGELNGRKFLANFSIQDFDDPLVALDFKGDLDAASIPGFFPIDGIKDISGEIQADVSFNGRLALLKKKATAQQAKQRGLSS